MVVASESHFSGSANKNVRYESSNPYALSTSDRSFNNFKNLSETHQVLSQNVHNPVWVRMIFLFFLMILVLDICFQWRTCSWAAVGWSPGRNYKKEIFTISNMQGQSLSPAHILHKSFIMFGFGLFSVASHLQLSTDNKPVHICFLDFKI